MKYFTVEFSPAFWYLFHSGPNIYLSIIFPNALNLWFSLGEKLNFTSVEKSS
jgi:hypothetical protein